jgi:uncharacterized protein YhdP
VQSNLTGLALKFPAPFAKAPADPSNAQAVFTVLPDGELAIAGNLGATRRFDIRYAAQTTGFHFARGAVRFGGEAPRLPQQPGLVVEGSVPELDVGEWLALAVDSRAVTTAAPADVALLGGQLDVAEFTAFGQRLGTTRLDVRRDPKDWNIEVTSEAIAGRLTVPLSLAGRPQIIADMQRVYLAVGADDARESAQAAMADPRGLPGLALRADEFGVGERRLGHVEADIVPDPLGLRLVSFVSTSDGLIASANGSWLMASNGPMTRISANLTSADLAAAFEALGIGAFMDGEMAELNANLNWRGGPGANWVDHVNGDVTVHVETGSLLDIDPGAGRVVGLLSIAALPRRLSLDFRDVFNRGFVFDEIGGDFTVIDGNAFTDNLKMSGPVAEIGVVGRTGLRDRDYQQQAVVTAEPSNVLPTVGALVAGPGVGAAWLLFTRIFKEPLKGIGRASYCVTGTWDEPNVERLSGDRVDRAAECAALPPAGLAAQFESEN